MTKCQSVIRHDYKLFCHWTVDTTICHWTWLQVYMTLDTIMSQFLRGHDYICSLDMTMSHVNLSLDMTTSISVIGHDYKYVWHWTRLWVNLSVDMTTSISVIGHDYMPHLSSAITTCQSANTLHKGLCSVRGSQPLSRRKLTKEPDYSRPDNKTNDRRPTPGRKWSRTQEQKGTKYSYRLKG